MKKWLKSGCPLVIIAWTMLYLEWKYLTNEVFDWCCIIGAIIVLVVYIRYELKPRK